MLVIEIIFKAFTPFYGLNSFCLWHTALAVKNNLDICTCLQDRSIVVEELPAEGGHNKTRSINATPLHKGLWQPACSEYYQLHGILITGKSYTLSVILPFLLRITGQKLLKTISLPMHLYFSLLKKKKKRQEGEEKANLCHDYLLFSTK